jgi:hypothetical protein
MDPQTLYKKANARAREKKRFFAHFLRWAVMSIFFILVNIFTSDYFWAIFPIMGWGIGLAMHGIKVYTNEWEDSETERELRRLKRKYGFPEDAEDYDFEEFKNLNKDWKDTDLV